MINEKVKQEFWEDYEKKRPISRSAERFRVQTKAIFNKAGKFEDLCGRDICDLDLDETENLLSYYNTASFSYMQSVYYMLSSYVDYCIMNGIKKSNINHFKAIDTPQMRRLLSKNKYKARYMDVAQFEEFIQSLPNAQDRAFLKLVREGVRGEDLAEFVNLTIQDVDQVSSTLTLTDADGTKRKLQVSEDAIQECLLAHAQEVYASGTVNKRVVTKLIPSDQIFRLINTRGLTSSQVFHRRLKTCARAAGVEGISPKSIVLMQIYERCKDLEGAELEREMSEINNRFYNNKKEISALILYHKKFKGTMEQLT